MSGHSKWSTIKHKKAATDAKRGKIFSKIAREIMVAARTGGGDVDANITLRALIQKARAANMPGDNIDRAIKKGTGDLDGAALEEMAYEGYAQGGVGIIVEALSDNRNRTAAEVKHAFSKHGASLAGQGAVSRLFQRKGQIVVDAAAASEERLMEIAIEAGAEDLQQDGEQFILTTPPTEFMSVVDALEKAEIQMEGSELTLLSEDSIPVTDKSQAASLLRFIEALEDLEDVQNVYSNFDISEELLDSLET